MDIVYVALQFISGKVKKKKLKKVAKKVLTNTNCCDIITFVGSLFRALQLNRKSV